MLKICGITRLDDALFAVEQGANALGFNFYPPSPRYVDPDRAARIIARLPPGVLTVGIFVRNVQPELADLVRALQIHGFTEAGEIPSLPHRLLVATSAEEASRFPDHEIIIDTSWGRGEVADWKRLKRLRRPFILSGGLNSENVEEAIRELDPAGVDVCSGVEAAPGIKDSAKLRAFLRKAAASFNQTMNLE